MLSKDGYGNTDEPPKWGDGTVERSTKLASKTIVPKKGDGKTEFPWLKGYAKSESRNVFDADEGVEGAYDRGANGTAKSNDFIDGSAYGSTMPFEFGKKDGEQSGVYSKLDDAPELKFEAKNKDVPYLTFSGGGHAITFTQSINDNVVGATYSWGMNVRADVVSGGSTNFALSIFAASGLFSDLTSLNIVAQRNAAWAKYANLATTYSLADPDPYDKFVLQVSTDRRYATPTFKTIGGASKCPGEPDTMWRESGMIIQSDWSAGVNNGFIPPGDDALYDITITNESPFRETLSYGLVLTTGETWTNVNGGT